VSPGRCSYIVDAICKDQLVYRFTVIGAPNNPDRDVGRALMCSRRYCRSLIRARSVGVLPTKAYVHVPDAKDLVRDPYGVWDHDTHTSLVDLVVDVENIEAWSLD
jgi:hypothetical protein